MNLDMLFTFLGGLAIFLLGMKNMGDGLQNAAADKIRKILEKLISNPIMGVIVGALVTAILQSSSGTTVITVGFVNARLLTLRQAVAVIMGANIGTTITAQLIAFKLQDYALPAIALGVAIYFFAKKKNIKSIGQIIIGFGLLFLGLDIMSEAMKPLRSVPGFTDLMHSFADNPILGVLTGSILTAVVQSSSATIAILQTLALEGLVDIRNALPILFGDNIGTTVTAILASIGTGINARRVALSHVTFNVIGTIIFLLLLPLVNYVVVAIGGDVARQIANAHTLFNVTNTVIQLPFISLLVLLVIKLIPGEEKTVEYGVKFLDKRLLINPSVALGQAAKELNRMGQLAKETLQDSVEGFLNNDEKILKLAKEKEDVVDQLEAAITEYLVKLSQKSLSLEQSSKLAILLNTVNDVERIGDHGSNIAELAEYKINQKLPFSEKALEEIKLMAKDVEGAFERSLTALQNGDVVLAKEVKAYDDHIDKMEKDLRKSHIGRLNEGSCFTSSGIIFLEVISNLERIGDHSYNIAAAALGELT